MTRIFQVINNRIQFRCSSCNSKRTMTVRPDLRKKNIKCHKCAEPTRCVLNRRKRNRDAQCGKIQVITQNGASFDADLHDISFNGVGFDLPFTTARAKVLTSGHVIRFHCNWNPRLLGSGYFKVKNVRGQRVGAQRNA